MTIRLRVAPAPRLAVAALTACLVLAGCSKAPKLPSTFDLIGETTTNGGTIYVLRDTGTGCEMVLTPVGVMPRNERSADGLAVKQRCVLTGDEQSSSGAPISSGGTPAETPVQSPWNGTQTTPAPIMGSAAQEDAVRAAIQEQTGGIPPAGPIEQPAPAAPKIPPPKGTPKTQKAKGTPPAPATPADGVESQLKQ